MGVLLVRARRSAPWWLLALVALGEGAAVRAQNLAPEAHWGGPILPSDRPELRAAVHINRFTEFSKTGQVYNEVSETAGFNMLSLSYTENTPRDPDLFFNVTFGTGYSGDQPSRWLQNDYVHAIMGQPGVPVGDIRESVEYAASGSLTKWFDGPTLFGGDGSPAAHFDDSGWRTRFFVGAGASTSTLYHEAFAQAGASLLIPDTFLAGRHVRMTLTNRATWPTEGNAYTDLADFSNVSQATIGLVPPHLDSDNFVLEFLGNPEFGLTATHDSGFFQRAKEPIEEWFAGFYVQWATGLRFETWNDFANGTDFGPTYGFRVSVDLFTLLSNSRWRW